jgi:MFS family permease
MTVYVTDYLRALRLVSRDVRMYLLTAALIGLSYFGFVTVLLNLYLLRLGYGTAFIGLVNGGSALAFAVSSVPAGAAGGRWGYRRTVVLGIFLLSAGTLLLPLSEYLPDAGRDAGVLLTRLLSGLGFALYFVNATPYLVAATEPEERTYVFSMQVALLPLGGFIGSLIAGMMPNFFAAILDVLPEHPAPYRYPLILAGVLLFPAVLALFTTREVTISSRPSETRPKTAAAPYIIITFLALTALLRMGGEGAARTFFNVYLDADLGVSTSRIGLLTAVGQLLAGPAALVAPLLVLRIGKMPAIVLSTMAMAGSLLLMGLVPHWAGVGFGFMGVISMRAITRSIVNVVQMEIVSPGWRGTTSGVVAMAMGIGFTSMALGGGYLIPAMGYRGLFLTAAGMGAASTLLFWSYFRVPRGEYARSDYAQQQAATVSP